MNPESIETGRLPPVTLPHLGSIAREPLRVSFEFFPPKSAAMESQLWEALGKLVPIRPDFISVTYGAGGSTRERTHAVVTRVQEELHVPAAAHLTCVNATRDEIDSIADAYWYLHSQKRDAWTFELDVRPYRENW